jgi:hypothetical protein
MFCSIAWPARNHGAVSYKNMCSTGVVVMLRFIRSVKVQS